MSNRWQASETYTLSQFKDADSPPFAHAIVNGRLARQPLGFDVQPDLGPDYTLASSDQRHRAVFNGIFDVGCGIQISGLYFYGSGERSQHQLRRGPAVRRRLELDPPAREWHDHRATTWSGNRFTGWTCGSRIGPAR